MAFIFRAYHAMQRQRPMSTRTGIPTAATYVFVNMINKLRKDFAPQYLAAVYDLSGPVFRNELAREMKDVQQVQHQDPAVRDQSTTPATRPTAPRCPPDLTQQLPYIRRALEAFRIPILTTRASRPTTSSARSPASSPPSATTSTSSPPTRT